MKNRISFIRKRYWVVWLLSICFLPLSAQDSFTSGEGEGEDLYEMSLEELMGIEVSTASKKAEKIDLAPNVMYVFTQAQIQSRGYSDLKDLFASVPGLSVFHKDIQFVGQVRGIAPNDNEKITVMVNGHPINNNYEPDYFNGALRIEQYDRIEIIVGPGSVLYGAQTLCATVNLITPKHAPEDAVNTVRVTAGNFDNLSGSMNYESANDNGNHLFFSAGVAAKGGFDAWPEDANDGGNRVLAGQDVVGKLYPSFVLLGNGTVGNWTLQFFSQNSQMAEEHKHKGAAVEGKRYDYIYSMVAQNEYELNENISTGFKAFGDIKRNIRTSTEMGPTINSDHPNWDIYTNVYGAEQSIIHKTDRNYFQAGIQAHINQHRHNYEYLWYPDDPNRGIAGLDTTSFPSYMRLIVEQKDTYNAGIYISDEYQMNENVKFVGAVRLDYNTMFEDSKPYISPRFAAVYAPKQELTFKLMYNKATRMPPPIGTDLNKLWGKDKTGEAFAPGWATANFNAQKPEQLSAYEFQTIYYQGKFRFALNAYYQELKDFFTWYNPRTNVGDFTGYGTELSVDAKINQKLSFWGNYAYAENDFTSSEDVIPLVSDDGVESPKTSANDKGESVGAPKHSYNIGTDITILETIGVSLYGTGFAGQPLYRNSEWQYAQGLYLNGAVNWFDIADSGFDLKFSCKNILNNREIISAQWLQDGYMPRGTNFELSLAYKY